MELNTPLTVIKGIGSKRASLFDKLGVSNIGALLFYFPRAYIEYPDILEKMPEYIPESKIAITAHISKPPINKRINSKTITTAYINIGYEKIVLLWFNSPYITKTLKSKENFVFYGKLIKSGNQYKMEQPAVYTKSRYENLIGHLTPVYSLTNNLKNNMVISAVKSVLRELSDKAYPDYLDTDFILANNLTDSFSAIQDIHFPASHEQLSIARSRIIFDEFFFFLLNINMQKTQCEKIKNKFDLRKNKEFNSCKNKLPFKLTNGQLQALDDIQNDLQGEYITQRMIQADVGSGKTIIAFLAMLLCCENGYRAAIMAPTEVLATQHCNTFKELIELLNLKYPVILLTGKMNSKDKKNTREMLAIEEPGFVIGTHALIQDKVKISNLALTVVDEQHRFGVKQRKQLSENDILPHSIVMSATPIPRSLAMILYNNMNITAIKDVPRKKLPIKSCILKEDMRTKAYQFLINEINKGHQGYIICPLIEASERTEAENVTDYYDRLKNILPDKIKIGLLHGRLNSEEKVSVMEDFYNKKYDILISTTVIEVGIDVANATVIIIENANRFGLSQLHQLRGRVGRGDSQSYCIFMNDKSEDNERLMVINSSNDGFFIANEDMRLRGPGELFGLRQSGELGFRLANIYNDSKILYLAREKCMEFINTNPAIQDLDHLLWQAQSLNNWNNI